MDDATADGRAHLMLFGWGSLSFEGCSRLRSTESFVAADLKSLVGGCRGNQLYSVTERDAPHSGPRAMSLTRDDDATGPKEVGLNLA